MFYPFEVADPRTKLHYRPFNSRPDEVALAPIDAEWFPGAAIDEMPDAVWSQSLKNAWGETVAAVTAALQELYLASLSCWRFRGHRVKLA